MDARVRQRSMRLLIVLAVLVAGVVVAGGVYTVYLANTTPAAPALPAGPPRAQLLGHSTTTDMLEGNFVLTTALYRSSDTPAEVTGFYRRSLHSYTNQIGDFWQMATTTLPALAPEALQHMPPLFDSPTRSDSNAARYVYTEYSFDINDVGIAVDMRNPHGPTLVYLEMLTQPNS